MSLASILAKHKQWGDPAPDRENAPLGANPLEDLLSVRRRLLRIMLTVLTALGLPSVIIASMEALKLGQTGGVGLYILLYLLLVATVFLYKRLPFTVNAGVMLVSLYLIALFNFINFSFAGAGMEMAITVSVLATLLLGLRVGLAATGLSLVMIVGVGTCFLTGLIPISTKMVTTTSYLISWITAAVVFVLLTGAMVLMAGMLQRHLIRSIKTVHRQAGELVEANQELSREISHRTEVEEKLKQSEEQFRTLFELAPDAIYLNDLDGIFLDGNHASEELMGVARETFVGQNFRFQNIMSTADLSQAMALLERNRRGESTGPDEFTLLTPKGKRVTVEISTCPLGWDNRRVVLGIARDVTERKRMEAHFNQAQKMEALGTLAGGIAHDFNNILAAMIGYTELALDGLDPDSPRVDHLNEVLNAGDRAKDLVSQILAFARQSGQEMKPLKVGPIAKEVARFIQSTIPATIEVRCNVESGSLIMGNATQLHQILMNLCTNAAFAMEENGGVLSMDLRDVELNMGDCAPGSEIRPGKYLQIKISDTGCGIPAEILGSIFEPYFTTKGPGKGTGMGLATVHGLVSSYGGGIAVESEPGKGTVFTICLPLTQKSAKYKPLAEAAPSGGGERILFVDDEAPIALMSAQHLERAGYRVSTRTGSLEALALFRTKPEDFDLVITDMTMPNLTGERLAMELMKIRPGIPVILCTGYSQRMSDQAASELGLKSILNKPVTKSDLLTTVRKVLDQTRRREEA